MTAIVEAMLLAGLASSLRMMPPGKQWKAVIVGIAIALISAHGLRSIGTGI